MERRKDTKVGKILKRYNAPEQTVFGFLAGHGIIHMMEMTDRDIEDAVAETDTPGDWKNTLLATREIAQNCDFWGDIMPYIRKFLPISGCPVGEAVLHQKDFGKKEWRTLQNVFGQTDKDKIHVRFVEDNK